MEFVRRHALWIAVAAQALLLSPQLDLLPLWDDERFTLHTAAQQPSRIIRALRVDVHPPLYYFLVHAWLKLPLPGDDLTRVRALSALFALGSTLLFCLLWLRGLAWKHQALFLGLWILSPCVVLYARIARSYTLQLMLAVVAIRLAHDTLRSPRDVSRMAGYIVSAILLLYTHYLPGLALVAATLALGLWRRHWRHILALGLITLAYLPWIGVLGDAAILVGQARPYWLGANWLIESALKISYMFVAFHFGETAPLWGMALGLALIPSIGWALWKAWSSVPPSSLLLLLAVIGYLIASSWVSFPFVGARLLFLLPFYYVFLVRGFLALRMPGAVSYAVLIVIACGSLVSYYRKQDFLNKGYLVDFQQIGRSIEERSRGQEAFILLDHFSSSAGYYLHGPSFSHLAIIDNEHARERALEQLRAARPALAWYVHYTRPTSLHRLVENELSRDYTIQRHGFVPYSRLDRRAMELLGFQDPPAYLVEVLEFRRR